MPPAVLVSLPFTPISSLCQSRVYTRPLLVDLATPNFNLLDYVITRACSAVALCSRDMYEEVFAIS
ncbi:hypothetical protein PENSPDRAFT_653108 [Peniophora sp. CONT]|nr:hypothetical protein PENSPDRAFT_653108 [Peniophora sp. CONT]